MPPARDRVLDLLSEEIREAPGLVRAGDRFIAGRPWVTARYGQISLARGWWAFECEGEGPVENVELRLRSPEDALLTFSRRRDPNGKVLLHTARTFDVSVLVSAWPSQMSLKTLRLRRLGPIEAARLAGHMLSRLVRSDRPFAKLVHVARSLLGGQSIRIASQRRPDRRSTGEAAQPEAATSHSLAIAGMTVVLRDDEVLDPRAVEVVAETFAKAPHLKAVYGDVAQGDEIRPRPDWDDDLAHFAAFAPSPVFFRGEQTVGDTWRLLRELSAEPGAVSRIPLPFAFRGGRLADVYRTPPVPKLERTPTVSIIIPTKIRIDLLERCLDSLASQTDYPAFDVTLVDNGADQPRFNAVVAAAAARMNVQVVTDFGPFNFSRLINAGVKRSSGEIVLMLNDDAEAVEPGWLHRMVDSAMNPAVGCVGARLLYEDRTIQHAGVTLGISGICGHLWKGLGEAEAAAIPQIVLPSGRMAVTGACLAIRRDVFDKAGGLDERSFPVAYNDVDLCLRVRDLGYRTVYRGDAVLIHHESQSRGHDEATVERRRRLTGENRAFLARWGHVLRDDPFGSPAFDQMSESGAVDPSLVRA